MPAQTAKKSLSPERLRQFHDWAGEYPNKRSMLMMTLRLVEEEFGCIDDAGMEIAVLAQIKARLGLKPGGCDHHHAPSFAC